MPNLQSIVCLGREAWECACRASGLDGDWLDHRESGTPLGQLIAAYDPAARVGREAAHRAWETLAVSLARPGTRVHVAQRAEPAWRPVS
jgi:hypothetical protein